MLIKTTAQMKNYTSHDRTNFIAGGKLYGLENCRVGVITLSHFRLPKRGDDL